MTDRLLFSFYGDDFTGSTDVMEALALHGVPTVLFLQQPSAAMLDRFRWCRAVGLAGTSRSQTPAWMDEHLAPAFVWLKGLEASFCQYKVCSTFDSSPAIGNIGRALDIGRGVFGSTPVPLVVGGPQLRRYTAFGQLFASFRGDTYRIDRHPVMSRHPVTPMSESDLRIHLAAQTGSRIGLVDFVALKSAKPDAATDLVLAQGDDIVLFDVLDAETQRAAGLQLLRLGSGGPLFVAGSSGVAYALAAAWQGDGTIEGSASFEPPGAVERIAVVSGSVSPTTKRQIEHAAANGFDAIPVDPRRFGLPDREAAIAAAIAEGETSLAAGRSVVLHTALGPSSDLGAAIEAQPGGRHAIGEALGRILKALVAQAGLRRAIIAGGDTSSHALRQLGVLALTTRLPLPQTPGSPLCIAHGEDEAFREIEIALKGGQIGHDDYFSAIRDGRP